jgi:hypothetical protein
MDLPVGACGWSSGAPRRIVEAANRRRTTSLSGELQRMFDGQCIASACSLKALRLNALPDVQIEEMNLFQDIRGVAAVGKVLVRSNTKVDTTS